MTREEAIDLLVRGEWIYSLQVGNKEMQNLTEAISVIDAALRPVSREQVEKVWRGEWIVGYDELYNLTYVTCSKCGDETVLNGCFVTVEGEPCGLEDFCSVCGAPMTDEAVDIILRRLEELKDGSTTDKN